MKRPEFEILEEKKQSDRSRMLVVDKLGVIGRALSEKLKDYSKVVFVTQIKKENEYGPANITNGITLINYRKSTSVIPDHSYTHIFVVYNGEKDILESISSYVNKAKEIGCKFILILPHFKKNEKLIENIISSYYNSAVIFYGDVFGPDFPAEYFSIGIGRSFGEKSINDLLFQAKKTGRILISGSGLEKTYPIFFEDLILGILETAFSDNNSSSIFLLFPKHAPTQLSIAHMLHKIDPLLRIDFVKETTEGIEEKIYSFPDGKYLLENNYLIEKKIKKTFDNLSLENLKEKKDILNYEDRNQASSKKYKFKNVFFYMTIFIFCLFLLPILFGIVFSYLGFSNLQKAKNEIKRGNFSKAENSANLSKTYFSFSRNMIKPVTFELSIIGRESFTSVLSEKLETGEEISLSLSGVLHARRSFTKVFLNKSIAPSEEFALGVSSLKKAFVFLEKMKAENPDLIRDLSFAGEDFNLSLNYISNTLDVFQNLFGFENKKTYLILFQNNMELRPGGGFIGSYGILNLERGRIKDFSIQDVYEADGKLKGHIEPPFPIRRYLPQVHLYLRDSNFNVDFSRGASLSAYLLNQETNQVVDGVIGIDITFVKNLLKGIGPVYVSDYNETVTPENLYLLTQAHAEKNSFPGSTQKRDFLRSLFNAIQLNMSSNKDVSYIKLFESIGKSISQKHILFAFSDQNIQKLFTVNGMSSSLWDERLEKPENINDFLGINEANIGVNKSNYFIRRKIVQNASLDSSGLISEKLTVMYKNTGRKNDWPGGDYKNYLRLIVPLGTKLSSISIDGKEQLTTKAITNPLIYEKKNFNPPKELEVEKFDLEKNTVYGFLFIVPVGSLRTITISYVLPGNVLMTEPVISYNNRVFKQPGTEDDLYSFSLTFPNTIKVVNSSDNLDTGDNLMVGDEVAKFSSTLSKDLNFHIDFAKK